MSRKLRKNYSVVYQGNESWTLIVLDTCPGSLVSSTLIGACHVLGETESFERPIRRVVYVSVYTYCRDPDCPVKRLRRGIVLTQFAKDICWGRENTKELLRRDSLPKDRFKFWIAELSAVNCCEFWTRKCKDETGEVERKFVHEVIKS